MLKFKFKSLADGFSALLLTFNGEKVLLEIPENLTFIKENFILSRFIDENVFDKKNEKKFFAFSDSDRAFNILNTISPNTVYQEKVFCAEKKDKLRDFFNKFKSKGYRKISSTKENIFSDDKFSLSKTCVLKSAPSYRCNYSRLIISILKTIKKLGSDYVFAPDFSDTKGFVKPLNDIPVFNYIQRKLSTENSPLKAGKTLYIPHGNYLFHRCGDFYVTSYGEKDLEDFLPAIINNYSFSKDEIKEISTAEFFAEDLPLDAYLIAEQSVKKHFLNKDLKDISELRLCGGDFSFSPSMPDVIGYADAQFDLVKRDGINVNTFKNAVFDFGTEIEEIINITYDLLPKYHGGQQAFEEAIKQYKEKEL
ncbi:MAG: hypothetical protein II956_14120 [Bacteroidales bacterium]|nr:hypothetical protein [Bacteroidales bacterium]